MKIKGKVCLVTGASGGIGREVARTLAARGARLALLARRRPELEALAAELQAAGREAVAVPADVTDPQAVQRAVAQAAASLGGLDLLVNNAGFGYYGPLERMSLEDLQDMLRTNIGGVLAVTQAALPFLKEGHGLVVNISSGLSQRALPFLSAYAGTKAMLNLVSEGMRMELRPYGVRVLTYGPPATNTDFFQHSRSTLDLAETRGRMKLARVEAVAERIVRAIERGRRQVLEGRFLGILNLLAPRLLDALFYRFMVAPRR